MLLLFPSPVFLSRFVGVYMINSHLRPVPVLSCRVHTFFHTERNLLLFLAFPFLYMT